MVNVNLGGKKPRLFRTFVFDQSIDNKIICDKVCKQLSYNKLNIVSPKIILGTLHKNLFIEKNEES